MSDKDIEDLRRRGSQLPWGLLQAVQGKGFGCPAAHTRLCRVRLPMLRAQEQDRGLYNPDHATLSLGQHLWCTEVNTIHDRGKGVQIEGTQRSH